MNAILLATCCCLAAVPAPAGASSAAGAWKRHVIDDASRGADGVRLADVNGDGRPDIATGWEEGGTVRAYLNPGPDRRGLGVIWYENPLGKPKPVKQPTPAKETTK